MKTCRVWITALHFTNCQVNSTYSNHNVVNHEKNVKQFFSQGKFNSSTLFFSLLYPHFTHPLHTIWKINFIYNQNYIAKCIQCYSNLKWNFHLQQAKMLAELGVLIAKWVSNNNLNADFPSRTTQSCLLLR